MSEVKSALPRLRRIPPGLLLPAVGAALILGLFSSPADDNNRIFPEVAAEKIAPQVPQSLEPLIKQYPASVTEALQAFKRGMDGFSAGNFADALAVLPEAPEADLTLVPDLVQFYRGRAYEELNRNEEALREFRLLRSRYPASSVVGPAIMGECRALLKLDNHVAALAALDSPELEQDAETLFRRGQAQEGIGNREEAVRLYFGVFVEYPESELSSAAEHRLEALSRGYLERSENLEGLLRRSEKLIGAGRSLNARTLLLRLARIHSPDEGLLQTVYLLLADADTNLDRVSEALRYLARVDTPALMPRKTYLEGVCYRRLRREKSFLQTLDRALELYPDSPDTERLLYSVATYHELDNRPTQAREAYRKIADGFPKGVYRTRAQWKVALFAYSEKRYRQALAGFRDCFLDNPAPGAAGGPVYWMGRCCERLGNSQSAAYLYGRVESLANNSYYGQKAHEALAALPAAAPKNAPDFTIAEMSRAIPILDRLNHAEAGVSPPSGAAGRIIERARQLASVELTGPALEELDRGMANLPQEMAALSYMKSRICSMRGDYHGSISTLRRVFPDYADRPESSLPSEVWNLFFPVEHWNLIIRQASKHSIDPHLVLGLIRQESAFNTSARSRAGARGLMQVLPSTGRGLARAEGIRFTTSSLHNPETNIALGTRYLAGLLQRYNNKVELALAAYNAGYNRVDRWRTDFGDVDMVEFVERIPLSETRGYIKQVLSNRAHYRLRIPPATGETP